MSQTIFIQAVGYVACGLLALLALVELLAGILKRP